jgi:hypothetical protein
LFEWGEWHCIGVKVGNSMHDLHFTLSIFNTYWMVEKETIFFPPRLRTFPEAKPRKHWQSRFHKTYYDFHVICFCSMRCKRTWNFDTCDEIFGNGGKYLYLVLCKFYILIMLRFKRLYSCLVKYNCHVKIQNHQNNNK